MPYADPQRQKKSQARAYRRNREKVVARSRAKRLLDRAWLDEQKQKPCEDCGGEFLPCVMEFHHRDPTTKTGSVANLLLNAGRQRVINEIAKCILLCANCHRVRTYIE